MPDTGYISEKKNILTEAQLQSRIRHAHSLNPLQLPLQPRYKTGNDLVKYTFESSEQARHS